MVKHVLAPPETQGWSVDSQVGMQGSAHLSSFIFPQIPTLQHTRLLAGSLNPPYSFTSEPLNEVFLLFGLSFLLHFLTQKIPTYLSN